MDSQVLTVIRGCIFRLTNTKPSAIYRLRPLIPSDSQTNPLIPSPPANLGIEIAPIPQLEAVLSAVNTGEGNGKGKGKEVVQNVDVGKVAEKIGKNVSRFKYRLERYE